MQGLHDRLRAATRPLHDALEGAVDVAARLRTRSAYVDALDRLWSVHAGFEAELDRHDLAGLGLDLVVRRRSPWLAEDIAALTAAAPRRPPAPMAFGDAEEALGGIYVFEGSTLGGQVLVKEAAASLGLSGDRGARFFYGHGPRTGAMWREVLAALAAVEADGDAARRVATGAALAFGAVLRAFEPSA